MEKISMDGGTKRKYFYGIIIKVLVINLVLISVFIIYKDIHDFTLMVKLAAGLMLFDMIFFFVPLFILYSNHKKFSNDVRLLFDKVHQEYEYQSLSGVVKFNSSDLQKVEQVVTPSTYDKRTDWVFWGKYFYTNVYLKTGDVISISCLVCDDIEKVFSNSVRKKKFFPLISRNISLG